VIQHFAFQTRFKQVIVRITVDNSVITGAARKRLRDGALSFRAIALSLSAIGLSFPDGGQRQPAVGLRLSAGGQRQPAGGQPLPAI